MKQIKLAYIGGGSKEWARVFMYDLALTPDICGEIALYDIDKQAALRNKQIGEQINKAPNCISKFTYTVTETLEQTLQNADFVVLSILPATFDEMAVDVHTPEQYGILQPVGDTVGPGGVLRAMRTVPIYQQFAQAIKDICPNAWVINLTNPMSICTKTLHDVFPEIKGFGCCHEVFHAQDLLACVAKEILGVNRPNRHEINVDASGINHFTWITQANFNGHDLMKLLPKFIDKYFESGYCEREGVEPWDFLNDVNRYGNKVKMDLFNRYGVLGAAGDRHLVEFMPNTMYLKDKQTVKDWLFHLTTVDFRKQKQQRKIDESKLLASGQTAINLTASGEEVCDIIQALLGLKTIVSNVNLPNVGQMPDMPLGSIVETNCVFTGDSVKPVVANKLPPAVNALVARNLYNIEATYHGIKNRDMTEIFASFASQPLCGCLDLKDAKQLFGKMLYGTRQYLLPYFDLKGWEVQ